MVCIYYCIYLYKLFEMLATIILVLRKKSHKVTYVHLINHAFTTLYIWTYARYAPGRKFNRHFGLGENFWHSFGNLFLQVQ